LTDRFATMASAMLVAIGLVYVVMLILLRSLLEPVVILCALPLAVFDAFVTLARAGHATNIIIGLAVSLHAVALPVAVIAAGIWVAYSVGSGLSTTPRPPLWQRT
jgi:multidrug efflux pump subunit AcrB